MDAAIADRVAKLLRLACDHAAPDGEKLAAIGRLSATAAAHDLDWNAVLAGNAPALTKEQMRQIYDEGYQRGHAHGMQQVNPARDWTPTGGSAELGDDDVRLHRILEAAEQANGLLTEWEATFCSDINEKFKTFRRRMYLSEKQWGILDRIQTKLTRAGYSFAHLHGAREQ